MKLDGGGDCCNGREGVVGVVGVGVVGLGVWGFGFGDILKSLTKLTK